MTNINQSVWKILNSDLAIQKDISRKLINSRALAKYIHMKYGLPASLDAVISAIRRFQSQEHFEEEEKAVLRVFDDARVSTKNNVAIVSLKLSPPAFFKKYCPVHNSDWYLKVLTGTREAKIVVEQEQLQKVSQLFKEDILHIEDEVNELGVRVSEKAAVTKGVIARMASELSIANINIVDLFVCMPEFLIYIKQKDTVKAHEILLKLCNEA